MDTATVWAQFGDTKRKAIEGYRQFMLEGSDQGHDPQFSGGGLVRSLGGWSNVLSMRRIDQQEKADERILGSGDFVNHVMQEAEKKFLRQIKFNSSGLTLTKIIEQECKRLSVGRNELESGSRRSMVSRTRAEITRRGMEDLGLSAAEIARHLGVATSSITRAVAKAQKHATVQRK
jgi:putative transposase